MNLEKYKDYRRIYPKLRLSWSMYPMYVRKDWMGVWRYLLGEYSPSTEKMAMGTDVHKWIEDNGYKKITGIDRMLQIIDLGEKEPKQEKKLVKELDDCLIVSVPDFYTDKLVVDWKTGKMTGYEQQMQLYMWMIGEECTDAYLVGIKPLMEEDKLVGVQANKVFQYKRKEDADLWEDKFITMAQDIQGNLKQLDKYINNMI